MKERPTASPADWASLLYSARGGDQQALESICERFRAYLVLIAVGDLSGELKAKVGASDIVQETMLDVCRDFRTFRGESEAEFHAWVRRIATNNLIDSVRRFRNTEARDTRREVDLDRGSRQLEPVSPAATASDIMSVKERDESLAAAIGKLPQQARQVLEWRHRDELGYAEIARRLGATQAAVRKAWSRAVATLRAELTHDAPARRTPR